MGNGQLYPFERNRYYPGKMLTSADFQAEQNYFIDKGRFMNSLMYGRGVVCGLGVFSLDDLSVLVESGVAIDGSGREIVVDTSIVKKLSAIDGFDSLRSDEVSLCVRFKEQQVHTVYAVTHKESDKDYEYNRVSEGYELYLIDKEDVADSYDFYAEFLVRETLFRSEHFVAEVVMPSSVSQGRNVRVMLEVRKLDAADVRLSLRGVLEIPGFFAPDNSHELEIGIEDIRLEQDKVFRRDYWMRTEETAAIETDVILRSGSAAVFENDTAVQPAASFAMKVRLASISPLELVARETGRMNLEMRDIGASGDGICIADITLVRTDSAYVIENVREPVSKHYITTPAQEILRNDFLSFYEKDVEIQEKRGSFAREEGVKKSAQEVDLTSNYATGTLEVPLGRNARRGDIRYSGEIAHGLGKGNVYVDIGYESIADDAANSVNAKSTIFGNPELFSRQGNRLVDAETAVKVLNDKGSFVVAARLLRDVDYLVLTYRWVAIRFPAGNELEITEDYFDKSISAETPTVIMGTKESHFFGVRFHNMKSCSLTYELTAPQSGEISSDGIYTSPSKDGVYEIRIYCTDMPVICTYAYAIVKKDISEQGAEIPKDLQKIDLTKGIL
ncbi:MAG: hypothetical protein J6O55_03645 [Lachnospiraceae bacterium]|nr:hypothetical protein [Lachnospiraceae bacterium]